LKGLVWAGALAGLTGLGLHQLSQAEAGGETRTLKLYAVNSKESLTTTYMVNGRHVASELAKINYVLRDWRRNKIIRMDTKTIDLLWELHSDLGSRAPIHVVSGYRSAETNALLKKIGRNVAKQSMHIQGKAIDVYFPDVPTERIRNSALVRQIGGVGYYPRSSVRGFVHLDSGRVRHWPRISQAQMAKIHRDYRKTVGARLTRDPATLVASVVSPSPKPAQPVVAAVVEDGYPVPTPRPRPIEVLMLAAAQLTIEPAAAPAPRPNFAAKPSIAKASLGHVPGAATLAEPQSNIAAKGSLAAALRDGTEAGLPVISTLDQPVEGSEEEAIWPARLLRSFESLVRLDGSPQPFGNDSGPAPAHPTQAFPPITEAEAQELNVMVAALKASAGYERESGAVILASTSTKGDLLMVNRSGKGDLIHTAPPPRYMLEKVETAAAAAKSKLVETFETLLKSGNEP
jgi:uncharacterized protein YcbK (DUF882 family)